MARHQFMLGQSYKSRQFLPCLAGVFSVTVPKVTRLTRQNTLYLRCIDYSHS